ncbi:hypothetical protein HDV06_004976 [Boothiomyces sp. JEL0866]|nr:hypothetical protein HDV06_004943 [Boothiomyces sp. JEL0866]KAJ3325219.1 hypothetical protein HDV06_004976 [Boothiomyces sp. JEL0866]
MSRASKITLISSIIFTTSTIGLVFWLKDSEEQARRVGLNKMAQERSKQRIENEAELLYQEELRKKLEKDQAVTKQSYLTLNKPDS